MTIERRDTTQFYHHYDTVESALKSYRTTQVVGELNSTICELITNYVLAMLEASPIPTLPSLAGIGAIVVYTDTSLDDATVNERLSHVDQQAIQMQSLERFIPQVDQLVDALVLFGNKYVSDSFSQSGVFHRCVVWGYAIYTLMAEVMPNEVKNWPRLFFYLKMCCYEDSNNAFSVDEEAHLKSVKEDFQRLLELSETEFTKDQKNIKKKVLFSLLWSYESALTVDYAVFESELGIPSQEEYEKILALLHFVEKVCSHPFINPTLKWREILPSRKRHFSDRMSEWYPKMVISYSKAQFTWLQKKTHLQAQKKGTRCKELNFKGEIVSSSSNLEKSHILFSDSCLNCKTVAYLYNGLFIPFFYNFKRENNIQIDITSLIAGKGKELAKMLKNPPRVVPKTMEAIRAIHNKIKSRATLQLELINLNGAMGDNLKRGPQGLFPSLQPSSAQTANMAFHALQLGDVFSLYAIFNHYLQNMSSALAKLTAFRKANLNAFETFLERYDLDFLNEHGNDLVEIAEEIHLSASTTVLASIEFMFTLGSLAKPAPAIFGENDSFLPPMEEVHPLSLFLAFVGGKQALKKVISRKEAALKPVVKVPEAKMFIPPSSSSSSSFSPSAPAPTAEGSVTTTPHKKVKKKSSVASLSSAAPLMSGPKREEEMGTTDDVFRVPKKMIALKKKLGEMGFVLLRNTKHTFVTHREDDSKQWIKLSHGSGRDDVKSIGREAMQNALAIQKALKKRK